MQRQKLGKPTKTSKCHLETRDCELGIALVVSRRYLESQFMGYISAKELGSTSPSSGLGKTLVSSPGQKLLILSSSSLQIVSSKGPHEQTITRGKYIKDCLQIRLSPSKS